MATGIKVSWADESRDGTPTFHDTLIEAQLAASKHYPFGHCTMASQSSYSIRDKQDNIVGTLEQVSA